jgi:hypothetical protein
LRINRAWIRDHPLLRDLAIELLIAASAACVYYAIDAFRAAHTEAAFRHAQAVIDLERWLGIYHELAFQRFVLGHQFLVTLSNLAYLLLHWPLIAPAALWLFLARRNAYRLYRTAFLVAMAFAFSIFLVYPVAPPRLLDAGYIDTAQQSPIFPFLQPPALLNAYAAMPSLHLCWNILASYALFEQIRDPRLRLLPLLIPVLMTLAIVGTANHYVLDALAGAALAAFSLGAARLLTRSWARRQASRRRESMEGLDGKKWEREAS